MKFMNQFDHKDTPPYVTIPARKSLDIPRTNYHNATSTSLRNPIKTVQSETRLDFARRHTTPFPLIHSKSGPSQKVSGDDDKQKPEPEKLEQEKTQEQQEQEPLLNNIQNSISNSGSTALSRHSISGHRPILKRNTAPAFRSHQELSVLKNDRLERRRDSILVKRNIMKQRMEDEKEVVIGDKISEGHENYVLAYNMLTGIRVAVSRVAGVRRKLTDEDFKAVKKLSFDIYGSELTPSSKYDFKLKDYSPEVFRDLRLLFGVDAADYLMSITAQYIVSQQNSPGKSGSFFYYSRDYRFIIKTIHHAEHKQLLRILKDYHQHVKENPNTLISQIYGLHRIKMPIKDGRRVVHFVVMNNLFPPHRDIHIKYDLKGSTHGRITKINPDETDLSSFTLKDMNFIERDEMIKFGPAKRQVFFKQLESDVNFLKKVNVMDYSLLMGIHYVNQGNKHDINLSIFDPKSYDKSVLIKTNPRDIEREDLPNDVYPGRSKYVFYGHDGGIRATNEDNQPLSEIYYMGIIDCLTGYRSKKKLETFFRTMWNSRSIISAVPPKEYGERFIRFIKKGTGQAKKKQS
ncbi:Phosphatidylinositol 4-phosphate 5-kinase its3 [Spathaspora sp. JA1]|nr:Phosphatidylinositol 4-phosphate 5-kinase its3 [Spathaspora sp. JA1]